MLSLLATAYTFGQAPTVPEDPTAPLRRFPFTILIKRPDSPAGLVSILHLPYLKPKDQIFVQVGDKTAKDWTFVEAFVSAAQHIEIKSWNLWEDKYQKEPIDAGTVPDSDVVPLFFLVLNKKKEKRILDAVKHSLEIASEPIISETAAFETAYQQQNRLYNFLVAYASLGPKATADPVTLQDHIYSIDADLGTNYNPFLPSTQPGDMQKGLDAAVGVLDVMRESPDNPLAAAQLAQVELPSVVSDWIGLVGDLVHIFFRPPKEVKLTFIPASATESDDVAGDGDDSMQLLTQRVCETKDDSLPTLTYRPIFDKAGKTPTPPVAFADTKVLAGETKIGIPLAPQSRDLFLHPWVWDWQISLDGKTFSPIENPKLVPGTGLVFPIPTTWWGKVDQKQITVKARLGFQSVGPLAVTVGRAKAQQWSIAPATSPDFAVNDPAAAVKLTRTGTDEPFYHFDSVTLKDAAGKEFKATNFSFDTGLNAQFNLAGVAPGPAFVSAHQQGLDTADGAVPVFVQPLRPEVAFYCGQQDSVLRIAGANAAFVKGVDIPKLSVRSVDDAQPGNRIWTLSGPITPDQKTVTVSFRDPATGLEWTKTEPLVIGLPRPKAVATLMGISPPTVDVGGGADPTWASATMPAGWFDTKNPIRLQLAAVAPFAWSHDTKLEIGLGSAGDVQPIMAIPEGPSFSLDEKDSTAVVTLSFDSLPRDATRNTGLLWIRLTRSDLQSPWTIAMTDPAGSPLRGIKLPIIQSVDTTAARTRITFSNVDQLMGVKFAGQTTTTVPQLVQVSPQIMAATVNGPPNATEFDLELRDATDGAIHVKINLARSATTPPPVH